MDQCGCIELLLVRHSQGHLEVGAVAAADILIPMVNEVIPVDERIMRLRISCTLGVISLLRLE